METSRIAVGELHTTVELLAGEPALVGEREFQLVAIMGRHRRAQDGIDGGDGHLGNTLHGIDHLLLLALQLVLIGEVLPLAAATQAEVLAHGLHAQHAGLDHAVDVALGKTVLLAVDLEVNHVARSAKRHKHHQVVPAAQALALGRHARYLKILNYRDIFLLLSHRGRKGTKSSEVKKDNRDKKHYHSLRERITESRGRPRATARSMSRFMSSCWKRSLLSFARNTYK